MLQSCGRKSFNNTENPSYPPLPSRISSPLTQNPGSAPEYLSGDDSAILSYNVYSALAAYIILGLWEKK